MHHGFLHSGAWVILDGSPIDLPVAAAMSPTVTTAAAQLTHDDGLIDLLTTTAVPPFETAAALQLSITGMLVPARPLYGLPSNKLDLPTAASPAFGMPSSAAKALQFGALVAPNTDPIDINMTIPDKATRLGKYLTFNATTGNPEAGSIAGAYTAAGLNNYNFTGDGTTVNFTSL